MKKVKFSEDLILSYHEYPKYEESDEISDIVTEYGGVIADAESDCLDDLSENGTNYDATASDEIDDIAIVADLDDFDEANTECNSINEDGDKEDQVGSNDQLAYFVDCENSWVERTYFSEKSNAAAQKFSQVASILMTSPLFTKPRRLLEENDRPAEYQLSPQEIKRLRDGSRERLRKLKAGGVQSVITREHKAALQQAMGDQEQSLTLLARLYGSAMAALQKRLSPKKFQASEKQSIDEGHTFEVTRRFW